MLCKGQKGKKNKKRDRIRLAHGLYTLQKKLSLEHKPSECVPRGKITKPETFIKDQFKKGYETDNILFILGDRFNESAIVQLVGRSAAAIMPCSDLNSRCVTIIDNTLDTLKDVKVTAYPKVPSAQQSKHFYIYTKDVVPSRAQSMSVDLSNAFSEMAKRFGAHHVTDNCLSTVPPNAEILIFDLCKARKDEVYKLMTSMTSTCGEYYTPRKELQVIILADTSIWELYGQWDIESGSKTMAEKDILSLEDRFYEICVHGRSGCTMPVEWCPAELGVEIQKAYHAQVLNDTEYGTSIVHTVRNTVDLMKRAQQVLDTVYVGDELHDVRNECLIDVLNRYMGTLPQNMHVTWDEILKVQSKAFMDGLRELVKLETHRRSRVTCICKN